MKTSSCRELFFRFLLKDVADFRQELLLLRRGGGRRGLFFHFLLEFHHHADGHENREGYDEEIYDVHDEGAIIDRYLLYGRHTVLACGDTLFDDIFKVLISAAMR